MVLLLRVWPAAVLAAALAGAVQAQTPDAEAPAAVQPGDAAAGTDTEEPAETGEPPMGAEPPAPPPTSYNPSGAYAPSYTRPVFPQLTTPVFIDQLGRTPDAPPSYIDQAYEARLRASFLSAQGLKGPLEGGWTLADAAGGRLYDLQLVDATGGMVDGAWRDLRRPGAIDASGLIVGASRIGSRFTLRFYAQGYGDPVTATLTAAGDGRWSGELVEKGDRRTVYLQRR